MKPPALITLEPLVASLMIQPYIDIGTNLTLELVNLFS